jgi:hypothetical protein
MNLPRRAVIGLLACAMGVAASAAGCARGEVLTGVTLRGLDGGDYPAGLPNDPAFFPIGVWLEAVHDQGDVDADRAVGLNVYVGITADSNLDLVEASGVHLLAQVSELGGSTSAAVDGWLVADEADMMYGPGRDDWSGTEGWNTCIPPQDQGGECGYTVMQESAGLAPDGELRYANYGMGVAFTNTDEEAAAFVNADWQDIVSADVYYFTHPEIAAADRKGASYGSLIDRVRELDAMDGARQPVWGFVEVGHPFTEDWTPTITAPQMRSAVWHSIIAGARGIVYFNHNFGGDCTSEHVLRDRCDPAMTPAVTVVNEQIAELAPVLNGPYADGFVTVEQGQAAVMAKRGPDGAWYVFAGANTAGAAGGDVTLRVAAGSTVEVLFEGRSLTVRNGRFVDAFADGNAVHIYRVT